MKILMLILASDGGKDNLYTKLQDIMRRYIHSNHSIEAYFYKADPGITEDYLISGDTIYLKTEETYPNLWKKFWLVLKAFENRLDEFSYIARPNLSTFIILERYLTFLETLPKTNVCSGIKFFTRPHYTPFPCGYLFTITPDLAKKIIDNDIIPENEGIDDRCMGILLQKWNVPMIEHNNYCIEVNDVSQYDSCIHRITNEKEIFMVRIRNLIHCDYNIHPFGIDDKERLSKDEIIHYELIKQFYDKDNNTFSTSEM